MVNLSSDKETNLLVSFLAGGTAGAVSRTAVSPFERAKILFQVQGPGKGSYKGIFPTIGHMYKEEGFIGLFRGNGINCLRVFPYQAVQFLTFLFLKRKILAASDATQLLSTQRLVCGGIAGTLSVMATYPMDLVRTRLLIQTAQHLTTLDPKLKPPGFFQLFTQVFRNEGGLLGLYRGFYPTTLGVAPYVAINFTVYESFKEFFPQFDKNRLVQLANGAMAGAIAQTLTYPFDLLRRRFQVLTMGNNLGFQYTSVMDALITIGRKEGFKGYYKGLLANLFKVAPSMAVSWMTFEIIQDLFLG